MKHRSRWISRLSAAPAVVLLLLGPALADPAPDTCQGKTVTIRGTTGNDQLIGTTGNDVISAGAGNDVVKGLEGDDTICGADGGDGLNGGPGGDSVLGGGGDDVIMGHDGHDSLEGGDGNDAIYGGAGDDKLYGGTFVSGSHYDTHLDFMTGNTGSDTARTSSGDQWYSDSVTSNPTCFPDFARRMGAYNPSRLAPQTNGCVLVSGKVVLAGASGDGDYSMDVSVDGVIYHVEFMPRDHGTFPAVSQDTYITVNGLKAHDTNHSNKLEIHPVFFLRMGGGNTTCATVACYYSGPHNGGSPEEIRPTPNASDSMRFCWKESGSPCSRYGTSGESFS